MAPERVRPGPGQVQGQQQQQQQAFLPLWRESKSLQKLYGLCSELSSAWEALGAEEKVRLSDTESVAAAAIAEVSARLQEWSARRVASERRCKSLLTEAQNGLAALGEGSERLASKIANAASVPLGKRAADLESILRELQQSAHAQRSEQLGFLGRQHGSGQADDSLATLGPELARLREAVQERRKTAKQACVRLQALWQELSVVPSAEEHPDDGVIRAAGEKFGVPDTEHEMLMRRLSFWESRRAQREQQALMDRQGRMRELGLLVLPQGELAKLSAFLEAHQTSGVNASGPALQAKEQELEALAEAQTQTLEGRRKAAAAALGSNKEDKGHAGDQESATTTATATATATPQTSARGRGTDSLQRLRGLATEVERLEGRLRDRCSRTQETARRAQSLWMELGEAPDERHDKAVLRVLAAGGSNSNGDANMLDMVSQAADVDASCRAWEARRAAAAEEYGALRVKLESLGLPQVVGPLLTRHCTLGRDDRAACRSKLQELEATATASSRSDEARLRQLYDSCGLASTALESLLRSLSNLEPEQRRARIAQELTAAQQHSDSISSIAARLKELVGERPERVTVSLATALQDPATRKALARQDPTFQAKLREDVVRWEKEHRKPLVFHALCVREWLESCCDSDNNSSVAAAAAAAAAAGSQPEASSKAKPSLPAELEAAAAKAMAALKAKLAALKSMPPPFIVDSSSGLGLGQGQGQEEDGKLGEGAAPHKEEGEKPREKESEKEKEEKRKKEKKEKGEKGEKGEKRQKKEKEKAADKERERSKSRKRRPSASSSESGNGKSHKQKRSRSRKKSHSRKRSGSSKKHKTGGARNPSSSDSQSSSASSPNPNQVKKKKKTHGRRHGRRSKSRSRKGKRE